MNPGRLLSVAGAAILVTVGCRYLTDGGTRVGSQLESGADRLPGAPGSAYTVKGITPATRDDCTGPYTVQFDKAGGVVVWCYDTDAPDHRVVGGGTTSHPADYVISLKTWIIDKAAGEAVSVDLERRQGRAVIVNAY